MQLSNRTLRVRLEQVNLSDLTNGPDFQFVGVLSAPAPVFTVVSFPFVPADPGPNPDLIEANVTVDIDNPALPWAAMEALPDAPWDATTWKAWTEAVKARTGAKGKALFMPLRLALTGLDHGPELAALLPLIGPERARARLSGQKA